MRSSLVGPTIALALLCASACTSPSTGEYGDRVTFSYEVSRRDGGPMRAADARSAFDLTQRRLDFVGFRRIEIELDGTDEFTIRADPEVVEDPLVQAAVLSRVGELSFRRLPAMDIEAAERLRREEDGADYVPPEGNVWLTDQGGGGPDRLLRGPEAEWFPSTGRGVPGPTLSPGGFGGLRIAVSEPERELVATSDDVRVAVLVDGRLEGVFRFVASEGPGVAVELTPGSNPLTYPTALRLCAYLSSGPSDFVFEPVD